MKGAQGGPLQHEAQWVENQSNEFDDMCVMKVLEHSHLSSDLSVCLHSRVPRELAVVRLVHLDGYLTTLIVLNVILKQHTCNR